MGKDRHFFYSLVFFAFFLSLAAKKKRSWLFCVYRAVYALFCNILTINCFYGCSAGRPANVKIRLAVFAFFSARCGSAGSPTKRNAMEPKRRRKIKLPFGTSATLSDQEAQGAGKILILCPADRNPSKKNQIVQ